MNDSTTAVSSSAIVQDAWGDFLSQFEWDYFATLTHRFDVSAIALKSTVENRFLRHLAQAAQQPVAWFYAIEHGQRVKPHAHALIGTERALPRGTIVRAWTFGIADISRFDPDDGAAWYTSKSAGQRESIIGISPYLRRRA